MARKQNAAKTTPVEEREHFTLLEAVQDVLEMDPADMDEHAVATAASTAHQPDVISMDMLKLLVARLAQILAQEADYLDAMNVGGLATLQEEKKLLVDALEKQKKLMIRRNRLMDAITQEQREELRDVVDIFNVVLSENHKRLLVAREINKKVVEAITELAHENARQSFYTKKGERAGDPSVSLSLNRSI
jgi:small-conductance mechanosensitive channel